jgi:hypothetical protein
MTTVSIVPHLPLSGSSGNDNFAAKLPAQNMPANRPPLNVTTSFEQHPHSKLRMSTTASLPSPAPSLSNTPNTYTPEGYTPITPALQQDFLNAGITPITPEIAKAMNSQGLQAKVTRGVALPHIDTGEANWGSEALAKLNSIKTDDDTTNPLFAEEALPSPSKTPVPEKTIPADIQKERNAALHTINTGYAPKPIPFHKRNASDVSDILTSNQTDLSNVTLEDILPPDFEFKTKYGWVPVTDIDNMINMEPTSNREITVRDLLGIAQITEKAQPNGRGGNRLKAPDKSFDHTNAAQAYLRHLAAKDFFG